MGTKKKKKKSSGRSLHHHHQPAFLPELSEVSLKTSVHVICIETKEKTEQFPSKKEEASGDGALVMELAALAPSPEASSFFEGNCSVFSFVSIQMTSISLK